MPADINFADLIVIDGLNFGLMDRAGLADLRDAGLTAVHVTCAVWEDSRAAVRNIRTWQHLVEANGDIAVLVRSGQEIRQAKLDKKIAVILGFQNSSPLDGDIDMVGVFHQLGVRVMQLTYNNQSLIATGCYEDADAGITRFGRQVIREMNAHGMIIDLSHVGDRSSYEAIQLSTRPVAITHANPKWFNDVRRNKSDHVLSALGERGGVIGLSAFAMLMPGGSPELMTSQVSVSEFCDMIARLADQIGVESVAIGTDDGIPHQNEYTLWLRMGTWTRTTPETGYGTIPAWTKGGPQKVIRRIFDELKIRGFAAADIAAVLGENWLRFLEQGVSPHG
jgi:membrane dipeptidase